MGIRECVLKALIHASPYGIITCDDVSRKCGIGVSLAFQYLEDLQGIGLIESIEGECVFKIKYRPCELIKAIVVRKLAFDLEVLCEGLDWVSFEELIKSIMADWGFNAKSRVRVRTPNGWVEFDVIAWRGNTVLAIESKKWRVIGFKIFEIIERHLSRISSVLKDPSDFLVKIPVRGAMALVPVVITWREGVSGVVNGVPVVPIFKLNDFLMKLDLIMPDLVVFKLQARS